MVMATGFVGVQHEFHDADFVRGWARRFVPTEPRLQLFDMILAEVEKLGKAAPHIVELGTGPGYMARHILERHAKLSYEALDFSEVFLVVARETIGGLVNRVTFTNADLLDQNWPGKLSRRPDAIVSTWALHDLGGRKPIADVYARCYETLPKGGVLVNGDFIKPDGTAWEFEEGRFEIDVHLDFLRQAGFAEPKAIAQFELNTVDPTTAQNYACLVAIRQEQS
jgi:SAM-dependent methyltransferase